MNPTAPITRTVAFKPQERNVFFHILTACNLSCLHCYINPEQHGRSMVPRQQMLDWLELFYSSGKETNVIFLGGEPTLHPDLPAGLKFAKNLGYRSTTIDTNGFLHHNLLDKITPEEADFISFSLDGPDPAVNDAIRGRGVFASCTHNLTAARLAGFRISVIYTVSRLNLQHLHRMPDLLARLGVNRFFIQVIGLRGKATADRNNLQVTPEEWLAEIPSVAEKAAAKGIHVTYPKVFLTANERFECAGKVAENYFIFPNGRVYSCPLCEDFPVHNFTISNNRLIENQGLVEGKFFQLDIPEGCVMNKILQPGNIPYDDQGKPRHRISCCLLKKEVKPVFG